MATIKSHTDLEQSKKLAEILPLESADMCWQKIYDENHMMSDYRVDLIPYRLYSVYSGIGVPCWSLASLLGVLPKIINNETLFIETSAALWHIGYRNIYTARVDNLIDACYELILKLNELNLL